MNVDSDINDFQFILALAMTVSKYRPAIDSSQFDSSDTSPHLNDFFDIQKSECQQKGVAKEQVIKNYLLAVDDKLNDSSRFWKNKYEEEQKNKEPISKMQNGQGNDNYALKLDKYQDHQPCFQSQKTICSFSHNETLEKKSYCSSVHLFIMLLQNDIFYKPFCLNVVKALSRFTTFNDLTDDQILEVSVALQEYDNNISSNSITPNTSGSNESIDNSVTRWIKYKTKLFEHSLELYYLCFRSRHNFRKDNSLVNTPKKYRINKESNNKEPYQKVASWAIQTLSSMSAYNIMTRYNAVEQIFTFIIDRSSALNSDSHEDVNTQQNYLNGNQKYETKPKSSLGNKYSQKIKKYIDNVIDNHELNNIDEEEKRHVIKAFIRQEQQMLIKYIDHVIFPLLKALVEPFSSSNYIAEMLELSSTHVTSDPRLELQPNLIEAVELQLRYLESLRKKMIQHVLLNIPNKNVHAKLQDIKWNILK